MYKTNGTAEVQVISRYNTGAGIRAMDWDASSASATLFTGSLNGNIDKFVIHNPEDTVSLRKMPGFSNITFAYLYMCS